MYQLLFAASYPVLFLFLHLRPALILLKSPISKVYQTNISCSKDAYKHYFHNVLQYIKFFFKALYGIYHGLHLTNGEGLKGAGANKY